MQIKIIEGANVAEVEKKANDFLPGKGLVGLQLFPHGSGLNLLVFYSDMVSPKDEAAVKEKPAKVAAPAAPKKAAVKKSADTKKPV